MSLYQDCITDRFSELLENRLFLSAAVRQGEAIASLSAPAALTLEARPAAQSVLGVYKGIFRIRGLTQPESAARKYSGTITIRKWGSGRREVRMSVSIQGYSNARWEREFIATRKGSKFEDDPTSYTKTHLFGQVNGRQLTGQIGTVGGSIGKFSLTRK